MPKLIALTFAVTVAVAATAVLLGVVMVHSQEDDAGGTGRVQRILESVDADRVASVIATVNGVEIRGEPVEIERAFQADAKRVDPSLPTFDASAVLDQLIATELVYQEAQRRGLLCDRQHVLELSRKMTSGPVGSPAYASYYGVSVGELHEVPQLVETYGKWCAAASLWRVVLGSDSLGTLDGEDRATQQAFIEELKAAAEIVIIDAEQ